MLRDVTVANPFMRLLLAWTFLAMEVRHTIPDQLNGDGKNQKSKNLVDGSDCAGPQPAHQRTSHEEEKENRQGNGGNPDHHAKI